MTAQELKMAAWEMDATASALAGHIHTAMYSYVATPTGMRRFCDAMDRAVAAAVSLQAYAHALQAEAAKEGAA